MRVATLELNPILTQEVEKNLIYIKQDMTELSIELLISLKTAFFQFLANYKDFSYQNLRNKGLLEILLYRALRFFKLEFENSEKEGGDPEDENDNESGIEKFIRFSKRYAQRFLRIVLFPFYIVIVAISLVYKEKPEKIKPDSNKSKRNIYIV